MPKYWEETNFQPRKFPRSGSKAKDGGKKKGKKTLNGDNNNGQLRIANATLGGARKAAWANYLFNINDAFLIHVLMDFLFICSTDALFFSLSLIKSIQSANIRLVFIVGLGY